MRVKLIVPQLQLKSKIKANSRKNSKQMVADPEAKATTSKKVPLTHTASYLSQFNCCREKATSGVDEADVG